MSAQSLTDTARALVAGSRGLLAIDESNPTCNKRFAALGIPQTEDARRTYRDWIVSTPGLSEYISGAILCDETIRQRTKAGAPFAKAVADAGIIQGIKGPDGTPTAGSAVDYIRALVLVEDYGAQAYSLISLASYCGAAGRGYADRQGYCAACREPDPAKNFTRAADRRNPGPSLPRDRQWSDVAPMVRQGPSASAPTRAAPARVHRAPRRPPGR